MRSRETLTLHLIRLYEGDFDKLAEIHTHRKPNEVIRLLVRRHIEQVQAQTAPKLEGKYDG
jgi:hypothetical protein